MWLLTSMIPAFHFCPQGNEDFETVVAVFLASPSSTSCNVPLVVRQVFSWCKLWDFGTAIFFLICLGSASVSLDRLHHLGFGITIILAGRKHMDCVAQSITGGCSDLLRRDIGWHKKKFLWNQKHCLGTLLNGSNGKTTPNSISVARLFLPLQVKYCSYR